MEMVCYIPKRDRADKRDERSKPEIGVERKDRGAWVDEFFSLDEKWWGLWE